MDRVREYVRDALELLGEAEEPKTLTYEDFRDNPRIEISYIAMIAMKQRLYLASRSLQEALKAAESDTESAG